MIFIYGLAFAQVKFYHECDEKEGIEVWQVSKVSLNYIHVY